MGTRILKVKNETIEWLRDNRILLEGNPQHPRLRVGEILKFLENFDTEPYSAIFRGNHLYRMGAWSFSHSELSLDTIVGRYCSISWNVRTAGPNHPHHLFTTSPVIYAKDFLGLRLYEADTGNSFDGQQPNPQKPGVKIGHDVWVGQDVLIMRGVTIGNGAMIAGGAVVTKDVKPYEIVGGNPARHIKFRFHDDVIQKLQESMWWDFPLSSLDNKDCKSIEMVLSRLSDLSKQSERLSLEKISFKDIPGEVLA